MTFTPPFNNPPSSQPFPQTPFFTTFAPPQPTFTAIVPTGNIYTPMNSKKRSPTIAFSDSESTPSSPQRPNPTRANSKRLQRRRTDRPAWVTDHHSSISLRNVLLNTGISNILWPSTGSPSGCRVLCFLGSTDSHLNALSSVADLLAKSFNTPIHGISLQQLSAPSSMSIPIIHDSTRTLTLHLGLLHPLGGGRTALDAIVVLDREGRRRMLLPVGWGVRNCGVDRGHLVGGEGNGEVENLVMRLVKGVEWLCSEAEEEDSGFLLPVKDVTVPLQRTEEGVDVDMDG
ncbi:hypothetical protein BJ508DRAFT_71297 [Ascobolus immersus RN42]|uniref:Uncharacterized protein n=1 Tax=Ascobolus immersus RN42 TaxID=1160509 RepID=A0A3N4IB84_ASCIM|nr:hypothetical protein BJ508DRAFT_71297 [Ascobolus immersus RN42]